MYLYAVLILLFKLFVCLSFGMVYVIHLDLFDSSFLSTSYGFTNVVSRLSVVAAPMVAELPDRRLPMLILLALNISACLATWFLRKKL
jgi:hypothetical protein